VAVVAPLAVKFTGGRNELLKGFAVKFFFYHFYDWK